MVRWGCVRRGARWGTAMAIGLVALAACAAPVPGRAMPVDVVAVPVAPGEPAPGVVPPPADFTGRLLESLRLAPVTPVVREVLPGSESGSCSPIGDLAEPGIVERSGNFPVGTVTPILQKYGYVAGWRSCATRGPFVATVVLSLEMADPAAARATATELAAASLQSGEQQTTVLNGARAQLSDVDDEQYVQVWMPVGRVVSLVAHQAASAVALHEATRLAEIHARLLATFRPTPRTEVAALPADPLGLGSLTAPVPGDSAIGGGPYDLATTLHTVADPVADRALLTANGYTGSYRRSSVLRVVDRDVSYRVVLDAFAGPAQAEAVKARLVALEAAERGRGQFAVPVIPDATCYASDLTLEGASRYTQRCFVSRAGFVATVEVDGLTAPDDVVAITGVLAAQVDLIDG
ncbi:DUF7373 family lipoprotein [Pseudonocardia lacus]|uniref:DUF7373 family lipoprotein n=1 Tax=Pseudonocardia lacus TaxID=2835865 RepID=UPI001BDC65A9|nr:hypothetical protein [Pseudonocardia lacus]